MIQRDSGLLYVYIRFVSSVFEQGLIDPRAPIQLYSLVNQGLRALNFPVSHWNGQLRLVSGTSLLEEIF